MSKLNSKTDQTKLIKNLESQQVSLKQKIDQSNDAILVREIKHNAMVDEYELANDKIEKIKNRRKINVSDHAVIRYLERVLGMDIEELKQDIITDDIARKIKAMGNGNYGIEGGFRMIVKDNVVLTIFKKSSQPK